LIKTFLAIAFQTHIMIGVLGISHPVAKGFVTGHKIRIWGNNYNRKLIDI